MGEIWDSVMGFVSDVTGINELDPDYEEEQKAKARAQIEAEIIELRGQLNSASAKERVNAEQRLRELQTAQGQEMRRAERDFITETMIGQKEHEEQLTALEVGAGQLPAPNIDYDKGKMASLVKRSKIMPIIPSMPQQERGVGPSERDTAPRRPY